MTLIRPPENLALVVRPDDRDGVMSAEEQLLNPAVYAELPLQTSSGPRYVITCEKHLAVAVTAALHNGHDLTGEVLESSAPCPICEWIVQHKPELEAHRDRRKR